MKFRNASLRAFAILPLLFSLACGGSSNKGSREDAGNETPDAGDDARVADASDDASADATVDSGPECSAPAVDQSLGDCTEPAITQCLPYYVDRGQWAAQGFSPTLSGKLTTVRLPGRSDVLGSGATAELLVVSADGLGDEALLDVGFDLAAHTLASVEFPLTDEDGWRSVTLSDAPNVTADEDYFLVLKQVGTDPTIACTHESCFTMLDTCQCGLLQWFGYNDWQGNVDSYARGKFFQANSNVWHMGPSYQDVSFELSISQCE